MNSFSRGMEWASALDMVRVLTEDERETMAEADHQEDEYARWFAWWYSSEAVLGVARLCERGTEDATKVMWEADEIARGVNLPAGVGRVTRWGQVCALTVVTPAVPRNDKADTANKLLNLTPMPEPVHLWRLLA